jgi:hypothetical protein
MKPSSVQFPLADCYEWRVFARAPPPRGNTRRRFEKRLGSVVAAPDATLVAPSYLSVSMICSDGPNRLPLAFVDAFQCPRDFGH